MVRDPLKENLIEVRMSMTDWVIIATCIKAAMDSMPDSSHLKNRLAKVGANLTTQILIDQDLKP